MNEREIELRIESLEKSRDDNRDAHKEIYDRLNNLEGSRAETTIILENIRKNLERVEKKLDYVMEQPRQNVNHVKITIFCSVVSGAIMLAVGYLFR